MRTLLIVVFVAVPAQAEFKRLHAERASASSFLESNWNKYQENYHPSYVLDDDPTTAWVEGADGDGVGESLTIRLSPLKKAKALRLVITPGYQKSKGLFAANGTPTKLGVHVEGPAHETSIDTELTLAPKWGTQTFEVPLTGGLASLTLTLLEVRAGKTYKDTCLSDVQVFVDSEVPYDKRVEEAKRQAMLTWKKERLATAKYFASLPPTYPFAANTFGWKRSAPVVLSRRYSKVWVKEGDFATEGTRNPKFVELDVAIDSGAVPGELDEAEKAELKALRTLTKEPKAGKWFSVSSKGTTRLPEGLIDGALIETFPPALAPLVRASDLTLFEAAKNELVIAKPSAQALNHGERGFTTLSTLRLLEGTPASPRRALVKHLEVYFERSDYEIGTWALLTWGEDGLLRRMVLWREEVETSGGGRNMNLDAPEKDWPPEVTTLRRRVAEAWAFTVADGKIGAIRQRVVRSEIGSPEGYGLSADEGISTIVTTFEPKAKK